MISWKARLARLPLQEEELVERIARAIYETHWGPRDYYKQAPPAWEALNYFSAERTLLIRLS